MSQIVVVRSAGGEVRTPRRRDRVSSPGRKLVRHVSVAIGLLILLGLLVLIGAHVHALDAAGAFAGRGRGIAGIKKFVDAIKADLIWVLGVCSGLAVVIVGGMFMMGHTRAQDYAMRAAIGFLVLAGGTGVVS